MPNRILKESICTSDSIDILPWFDEVFFYRLMVNCDDYGRMDARPKILKARLFPLKSEIRDDMIVTALYRLSLAGIAHVFIHDGRPYLQLRTWGTHQTIRNKKSKFPALEESEEVDFSNFGKEKMTVKEFENICNQLISTACKCPRNPIQSNTNPNTNPNPIDCSEQDSEPDPVETIEPEEPVVITITLNDGSQYPVEQSLVDYFVQIYPNVDVMQELRNMKAWSDTNPKKRKTKSGIKRFMNSWLMREQDRGGKRGGSGSSNNQGQSTQDYAEMIAGWANDQG